MDLGEFCSPYFYEIRFKVLIQNFLNRARIYFSQSDDVIERFLKGGVKIFQPSRKNEDKKNVLIIYFFSFSIRKNRQLSI